jgi:hypothetical protein
VRDHCLSTVSMSSFLSTFVHIPSLGITVSDASGNHKRPALIAHTSLVIVLHFPCVLCSYFSQ